MSEGNHNITNVGSANKLVVNNVNNVNNVTNNSITNITVQKEGAMVHKLFLKAAKQDRPQVARKHLLDGAFVDQTDSTGKTAFDWALIKDSVELAKVLVEFEADLDDPSGVPFIDRALDLGKPNVTLFLLNQTDRVMQIKTWLTSGKEEALGTLLSYSAELVEMLHTLATELKSSDPELSTRCARLAAKAGHAGAAGHLSANLLRARLGKSAPEEGSWSPAHEAALAGDLVKLRKANDISSTDSKGNTPLHWAVVGGDVESVETLLSMGANIETMNASGNTPLHLATLLGQAAVANALQAHGADKYAENFANRTPLLIAVLQERAAIIKSLLHGSIGVVKAKSGKSYLEIACLEGKGRSVDALLSAGVAVDTPALVAAAGQGDAAIVRKLVGQVPTEELLAPINKAAENGQVDCIRVLLEAGAPVDLQMVSGGSGNYRGYGWVWLHNPGLAAAAPPPIYYAARGGHADAVELLISHGAKTSHMKTCPLHYAAQNGHLEVVKVLLKHGAPVNHQSKAPRIYYPSPMAEASGHPEIVQFLASAGGTVVEGKWYIPNSPTSPSGPTPFPDRLDRFAGFW